MQNHIITIALPYANGDLHLGHILEAVQADIWVRQKKMQQQECIFLCADDAHGSAIMLKADELGISPEAYIKTVQKNHIQDFNLFNIDFSCYHSTHSQENAALLEKAVTALSKYIVKRDIKQLYDTNKNMFLPDRFVKGTCPHCKALDQYGDNCEKCGSVYSATDLIDPISVLTGSKPSLKATTGLFLQLNQAKELLINWLKRADIGIETKKKLSEWLSLDSLKDWAISRDAPYFGFNIPGYTDKFAYVWLDAPLGYLATLAKHTGSIKAAFEKWNSANIVQIIGKDIINFHGIFWPVLLGALDIKLPDTIGVHGFLQLEGKKMSKSANNFLLAKEFSHIASPELFRYYAAAKIAPGTSDIDFSKEDFIQKINSALVGKFVNIPSRICGILAKHFDSELSTNIDLNLMNEIQSSFNHLKQHYDSFNYNKAITLFEQMLDKTNQAISEFKPWQRVKEDKIATQDFCSTILNAFIYLSIMIKPVLPNLVDKIETMFKLEQLDFSYNKTFSHTIYYQPLLTRI